MINFRIGKTQRREHWKNIHPSMERVQIPKTVKLMLFLPK
jgi:hypothetical protein